MQVDTVIAPDKSPLERRLPQRTSRDEKWSKSDESSHRKNRE